MKIQLYNTYMHIIVTFCLAIGITKPKANTLRYCVANQRELFFPPLPGKYLRYIHVKLE